MGTYSMGIFADNKIQYLAYYTSVPKAVSELEDFIEGLDVNCEYSVKRVNDKYLNREDIQVGEITNEGKILFNYVISKLRVR